MQTDDLDRLADIYVQAIKQLGASCTKRRARKLALNVQLAMSAHGRNYHNLDHVFSFVDPNDPVCTLAAMYHDIVYYQVDQGFTSEILSIIIPYIYELESEFYISNNIQEKDRLIWMTMDIFNLKAGQKLSSVDALNEFLSAIVLVRELGDILEAKYLLQMIVCIEATIPFRGRDRSGLTPLEVMAKRLPKIAKKYCSSPLKPHDIEKTIRTAVVFSNKDIGNFSESDPARFLDNTWKLLPETNVALRDRDAYSIRAYRIALQKMRGFMMFIKPELVFNQYHGIPSDDDYKEMVGRAEANILIARDYLRVRLVAIAVLEALAQSSGGDTPLSTFMGNQSDQAGNSPRIEDFLPDIPTPPWVDQARVIRNLLEVGRASESTFDTRNSRLSLFVFKSLTPEAMEKAFEISQDYFSGKMKPEEFLDKMDKPMVSSIARASASMVLLRRDKLIKFGTVNWS
jgi:hypothetical protein